nr:conotoxin precursor Tpra06 [Conus ebraeus]DAZ86337.1 TPA_inf: conotoxin precursor Tpra06 [Conus ebraeus]
MLSMLAWTLMTAMVVMNAHGQVCPTMTDSYTGENECFYDNNLCGKEVSGSCSSRCYCKNGGRCSTDSDHTITVVQSYINGYPEKRYYTCVALSSLNECAVREKALFVLAPEAADPISVKVLCRCPFPKVYLQTGRSRPHICSYNPRRRG